MVVASFASYHCNCIGIVCRNAADNSLVDCKTKGNSLGCTSFIARQYASVSIAEIYSEIFEIIGCYIECHAKQCSDKTQEA